MTFELDRCRSYYYYIYLTKCENEFSWKIFLDIANSSISCNLVIFFCSYATALLQLLLIHHIFA